MDTNTPTTGTEMHPRTPFYRRTASRKAYWLAAGFLLAGLLAWTASVHGRCCRDYHPGLPALDGVCMSDTFYYVAATWAVIALIPWLVVRFLRANALGWQKMSWFSLLSFLSMVGCFNLYSMLDKGFRLNLINHPTPGWIFLSYVLGFLVMASFVLLCYNEFGNAFFRGDGKGTKAVSARTLAKIAIILPSIFMVLTQNLPTRPDPYEGYLNREAEPELTPPDSMQADDFAFEVFRDIVAGSRGNVVFSPAGLESQMRLLRDAAGGPSREAIDALPMGDPGVSSAMRICTACTLFVDKDMQLKQTDAKEPVRVPFSRRPDMAAELINRWGREKTKGCIDSIVNDGDIDTATRLISATAIYLDARWLHPFAADDTSPRPFHLADGTVVETPMMEQTTDFRCAEGEDWQAVALFYRTEYRLGESGCFIGILPKGDAREFAKTLTASKYNDIRLALARAELKEIRLTLPKMEVRTQNSQLDASLKKQGLGVLFDPSADFSGLTDERVYLDSVSQCCYVKVDEQGTVAAAATASLIAEFTCFSENYLYFDKPFIWAIGDLTSDAPPYFLGLFETP